MPCQPVGGVPCRAMRQQTHEFVIATRGPGLVPFTDEVVAWVAKSGIREGLLTLHVRHTSASLVIQENADPEVLRDFERFFRRLVPAGDPLLRHTAEGPDDMPAHLRSALTQQLEDVLHISTEPRKAPQCQVSSLMLKRVSFNRLNSLRSK